MLASLLAVAAWTTPIVSHPGLVTQSGLGKHSESARVQRCSEPRAEYGDKYYSGATGPLPENVFEVVLPTPLGIQFEENDYPKKGVSVVGLVPDSNAAKSGLIAVGDYLVGVTAIQFQGAKWERRMLDCRKWDFDTASMRSNRINRSSPAMTSSCNSTEHREHHYRVETRRTWWCMSGIVLRGWTERAGVWVL